MKLDKNTQKFELSKKKLVRLPAAAKFLDVSESYMYKLTSNKEIRHFKPNGKTIYFLLEDLEAYVLRGEVKPEVIDQEAIDQEATNYITLKK